MMKIIQIYLNEVDYANLTVDGIFGPETEKAVRKFQTQNGLVVDGIVGYNTLHALRTKHDVFESRTGILAHRQDPRNNPQFLAWCIRKGINSTTDSVAYWLKYEQKSLLRAKEKTGWSTIDSLDVNTDIPLACTINFHNGSTVIPNIMNRQEGFEAPTGSTCINSLMKEVSRKRYVLLCVKEEDFSTLIRLVLQYNSNKL
jgi:hypothetical protein